MRGVGQAEDGLALLLEELPHGLEVDVLHVLQDHFLLLRVVVQFLGLITLHFERLRRDQELEGRLLVLEVTLSQIVAEPPCPDVVGDSRVHVGTTVIICCGAVVAAAVVGIEVFEELIQSPGRLIHLKTKRCIVLYLGQ